MSFRNFALTSALAVVFFGFFVGTNALQCVSCNSRYDKNEFCQQAHINSSNFTTNPKYIVNCTSSYQDCYTFEWTLNSSNKSFAIRGCNNSTLNATDFKALLLNGVNTVNTTRVYHCKSDFCNVQNSFGATFAPLVSLIIAALVFLKAVHF